MKPLLPSSEDLARMPIWQRLKATWDYLPSVQRALLHECLAHAYEAALQLVDDRKLWLSFRADPGWVDRKKPKKDHQSEALRWVLSYAVPNQKTSSLYYRALKPYADRRASRDEVEKALLEHGVRRLASSNSKPGDRERNEDRGKNAESGAPFVSADIEIPPGWVAMDVPFMLRESDFQKLTGRSLPIEGVKLTVTIEDDAVRVHEMDLGRAFPTL